MFAHDAFLRIQHAKNSTNTFLSYKTKVMLAILSDILTAVPGASRSSGMRTSADRTSGMMTMSDGMSGMRGTSGRI